MRPQLGLLTRKLVKLPLEPIVVRFVLCQPFRRRRAGRLSFSEKRTLGARRGFRRKRRAARRLGRWWRSNLRRRARWTPLNGTNPSTHPKPGSGSAPSSLTNTCRDGLVRNGFPHRHVLRGTAPTLFNRFAGSFFEAASYGSPEATRRTSLTGEERTLKRRRPREALSKVRNDGPRRTSRPGCVQCALRSLWLTQALPQELVIQILV